MRETLHVRLSGLHRYLKALGCDIRGALDMLVAKGEAAQPRLDEHLRRICLGVRRDEAR